MKVLTKASVSICAWLISPNDKRRSECRCEGNVHGGAEGTCTVVRRRNEGLCRCKRAGGFSGSKLVRRGETDGLIEEQLVEEQT